MKWKNQIGHAVGLLPRLLATGACSSRSLSGKIVALRARNGKVLWQKQLGSRTESSPIVRNGVVYFGTEGGDALRAVRARPAA